MIRLDAFLAVVVATILLWHECGEDIGVFCYRIGMGALARARSRALVPALAYSRMLARNQTACLNRSGNFSTLSMTSKD